eukprot:333031_1
MRKKPQIKNTKIIKIPMIIDDTNFEKSYYISVDCHICKKDLNSLNEYRTHLEKHYEIDHLRTWLKCDMGCKNKIFTHFTHFMSHIASHTKNYPFKCGILYNGNECIFRAGTKSNMKKHWNSKHNKNESDYESLSSKSNNESESESESESEELETEIESESNNIKFESNGYFVSINCHICGKYFNNYNNYKQHIHKHYMIDKNKTWLECEFCQKKLRDIESFLCHIAYHTKDYPFKCNKCEHESGTKSNLLKHWNLRHNKNKSYQQKK